MNPIIAACFIAGIVGSIGWFVPPMEISLASVTFAVLGGLVSTALLIKAVFGVASK